MPSRFGAPTYATRGLDDIGFKFLNEKELETLINEPNVSVIKTAWEAKHQVFERKDKEYYN